MTGANAVTLKLFNAEERDNFGTFPLLHQIRANKFNVLPKHSAVLARFFQKRKSFEQPESNQ